MWLHLLVALVCLGHAVYGVGGWDPVARKFAFAFTCCGLANLILAWEKFRVSVKYRRRQHSHEGHR